MSKPRDGMKNEIDDAADADSVKKATDKAADKVKEVAKKVGNKIEDAGQIKNLPSLTVSDRGA
jgi:hypothetical protein